MLGKTVTQAFGCGIPIEVNNGLNPNFTAGGSSSGSAAAVAARMVPLALGSQSASSLIRPCSYNGVVGMRPSFGIMSLSGFKYFNWSFDTLGLVARSIDDVALLWQIQTGVALEKVAASPPPKIGLCEGPWWKFAKPASRQALHDAAGMLARDGADVVDFKLPPNSTICMKPIGSCKHLKPRIHTPGNTTIIAICSTRTFSISSSLGAR